MSALLNHPKALSNILRRIAVEAGDIILDYYDGAKSIRVEHKTDGSPVTNADQAAEHHIREALIKHIPDIPFIGEETPYDLNDLQNHDYFWCVDPLDGTKAFIKGEEGFTVNIALVHKTIPVVGIIYAPATGDLYAGFSDTAIKWRADNGKEKTISVRPPPSKGLVITTSGHHMNADAMSAFLNQHKIAKHIRKSSSLKLCLIAEGKADMYPRFGPTSWWDIAAGHAILNAAGGTVNDICGNVLSYGASDNILNPSFIASGFDLSE